MAKGEFLSFSTLLGLATSPSGLYLIGYAWLFGMSLWVTFFGGVIAFKALPRQQFGALQHKTFPVYFVLSMALSGGLITLWTREHPHVTSQLHQPLLADVFQIYALGTTLIGQGVNYLIIGPMTSKTMFQRHRLERDEGKAYNEPGARLHQMKALNRRFGMLHGISSLFNLGSVIALGLHGLWIGNAGVKGQ
ncbi:hypothetical protein BDN72DRAFT_783256 [Pluteus cervinus]|uniref:Uncharacterized protein n=1 Tax=Pluteus cervinus TaxID=181527 RepID=A0ACD3BG38_9AGAR|nr:hypothetical protein BDN72DRAFT_783256 [Pluteus cervinus]